MPHRSGAEELKKRLNFFAKFGKEKKRKGSRGNPKNPGKIAKSVRSRKRALKDALKATSN